NVSEEQAETNRTETSYLITALSIAGDILTSIVPMLIFNTISIIYLVLALTSSDPFLPVVPGYFIASGLLTLLAYLIGVLLKWVRKQLDVDTIGSMKSSQYF
ncbi:hypothetical protein PENTCL1PPCAC_14371, partial [Pristionchus entomophagus]